MENLGKYLQEQREDKNVSIDEMAFRTKIPVRYIHAIEQNRFDQLPSQVSAKGFLKSYVHCLGLEDETLLEALSQQFVPEIESFSSSEYRDEILSHLQVKNPSRLPFPRRVLLLVGAVVVLLLLLAGLLPKRDNTLRSLPPPPLSEDTRFSFEDEAPMDSLLTEVDVMDRESQLKPGEEDVQSPKNALTPQEDLGLSSTLPDETISTNQERPRPISEMHEGVYVLSIEASEPSWVLVEIDGEEVREVLLQPNDVVKWSAKEKFLLKLGNAGGVRVFLDGKDLGSFGPSGEVVEKEIIGAVAFQN